MKDHAATRGSDASQPALLGGAIILVVEDEALLAYDLAATIEESGGVPRGPIHRLDEAMACEDLAGLDAALLDVDIAGKEVFAFADRLSAAEVPIVFHTARADVTRLRLRYPEAAIVYKPCLARAIAGALSLVMLQRNVDGRT